VRILKKNKLVLDTYEDGSVSKPKKGVGEKFVEGIKNVFVKPEKKNNVEDVELNKLHEEAKQEAFEEVKTELKQHLKEKYKKQQISKLTQPKQENTFLGKLNKFSEGFSKGIGNMGSTLKTDEKLKRMLGSSKTPTPESILGKRKEEGPQRGSGFPDVEKLLGKSKTKKTKKENLTGGFDTTKMMEKMGVRNGHSTELDKFPSNEKLRKMMGTKKKKE